jgi:D-alanyl-D-alanine carboxypeptidase (penicillin-binding protein 5/6)
MINSSEASPGSTDTRPQDRAPRRRFTHRHLYVLIAAGLILMAAPTLALAVTWQAAPRTTRVTAKATAIDQPTPEPANPAVPVFDVPTTAALPGTPPRLPWPATGQATVAVDGVGSLGATPNQHPVPIASLAKVMTAYLVLRDHPISAGDDGGSLTVTTAEANAYATEVANNESLVKVAAGEVLTERQALEALLLPSANNMARILARWDAGTIPAFIGKMNATAATLGMTSTHYTDPSGYDPATRSTADDQVVLATHAMPLPAFAQIVAMPTATIPIEGTVRNYNTLLGSDGIVGIKTGSTSSAGGCLLFAAHHQIGGRTTTTTTIIIIGAVLGQQGTTMHGLPQALSASARLIEAAAGALNIYTPIKAGQTVATIAGTDLVAATNLTILGWPGLPYRLTLTTDTTTPLATPQTGTPAGHLELEAAEEQAMIDIVR